MTGRDIPRNYEVIAGSFDDANASNIPVEVTLVATDDGSFELYASNYMPNKSRVIEGFYGARAADPQPLREIITDKIVPLYGLAIDSLKGIVDGSQDYQIWREHNESKKQL